MKNILSKIKLAKHTLSKLSNKEKSNILLDMAKTLDINRHKILQANKKDLINAKTSYLEKSLIDRLEIDNNRLDSMILSLKKISALEDPVGRILDGWVTKDNLRIEKVSIPIGVILVIYESRPNVTSDVAGLCFKSGNIIILKGGKEAKFSNEIISKLFQNTLEKHSLPKEIIYMLENNSREKIDELLKEDKYIDLIIPRGGSELINYISKNSTIPIIKHDKGLCHTYIQEDADLIKASSIVINAKCQRPSVCNSMETLLIDNNIAKNLLPKLYKLFIQNKTELVGCAKTREFLFIKEANEDDFHTEYLSNKLSIKIVANYKEAIEHIQKYGSGHSDAIITENYSIGEIFLNEVDSSSVYINASTRFTDGEAFGFGAEVGISTNRLHARGPMGLKELTTYKFKIYGQGQIKN